MPRVGEAFYELTAKDAGLFGTLAKAESGMAASGKAAEAALGGGVAKGMAEAESAVAGGTGRMGGLFGSVGNVTDKFKGKLGDLKTGIVQGLGIGGFMAVSSAASEFIGKITNSIGLASDLNETVSKSAATFGPAADVILQWSKTTASSMGIAQVSALDYSATFGGLLQNFGLTAQAAAPMSQSLVQLAADMASFSNSTPEEALDALRSGLIGESEPLRRFQVNLSEARIQQKALELGLWSGKGAIDASAKAQATYAIIMQDTARQQGDFTKTASGMANQQRISAAQAQEAWTNFGAALLPLAAVVMPAIAHAGTGVVNFLTALLSHGREVLPVLIGLGVAVAVNVVPPFAAWAIATVIATAPLIALAAAVAGVVFILDKLGLLGPILDVFWNALSIGAQAVQLAFDTTARVIGILVGNIIGIVRNVIGIAAEIPGPWQDTAKQMKATLTDMQVSVETWGTHVEDTAGKAGNVTPKTFADNLAAGAPAVDTAAKTAITDPVTDAATTAKATAVKTAKATPGAIAQGLQEGKDAVASGADALKKAFEDHISPTKEIAQLQGDLTGKLMKRGLSSNDPIIRAAAQQWKSDIEERLFVLKNNVGGTALKTGQNYADALEAKKKAVAAAAAQHTQAVNSIYSQFSGKAKTWGQNTAEAYGDGLRARVDYVASAAGAITKAVGNIIRASSPPGPLSPLHLIDVWGERTAEAYAEGWTRKTPNLVDAVAGFLSAADTAISRFTPTVRSSVSPAEAVFPTALLGPPSHTSSVSIGDVNVPISFDGPPPTSSHEIRRLGRAIGEEVRMSLTRTLSSFPVGG